MYLDENMLFGSSRLGLQKRGKKLSFVAEASNTPVAVIRGQKRYELSNHLGNVHLVVSDRKQMVCSGNAYSHYEAEIINTYDYYPFGMLMEERKGARSECTASTSAVTKPPYNYTFTWLTHDFIMYGTNVTVNSSGSALIADRNASSVATNWGVQKSGHSLVKGVTYTLSYQLQGAAPSGYTSTIGRTVQVRLKWGATIVASGTLTLTGSMQSGSFNYTADYTGNYTIEIVYTGAGLTKCQFLADNVKITYNSEQTTVNCLSRGERYRYGHNGQEKDDDMYGVEGTSYTAEYWQYDSRLGRRWNVDPVFKPERSPYDTFDNNPILRIDYRGDNDYVYDEKGMVVIEIKTEIPDRHFMLHEKGDYILKQKDESRAVIRVLSREAIIRGYIYQSFGKDGSEGLSIDAWVEWKQLEWDYEW